MSGMPSGSVLKALPRAPSIPVDCAHCPIREQTVCRPFRGPGLEVVQSFKLGDRFLPAGSDLFWPGQELGELFNLLDGWVVLYRILASGRRQIVDFALPGAFLGYQPQLDQPIQLGAECLTDVAVCTFPRKSFHELALRHPALSLELAKLHAQSLMRAHAQLANVGSRPAVERTAHFLCEILLRLRRHESAPLRGAVDIPLTQTHIAEALGLSSVYVNKTLRELREEGVLILKSGRLTVLDPVRLAELAEFDAEFGPKDKEKIA